MVRPYSAVAASCDALRVITLTVLGLVTGQIAAEIEGVANCIEQLYGVMNEDSLELR